MIGSGGSPLDFGSGAAVQRIFKTVGDPDHGGYREHYIRDAQGNIMAIYRSQEVDEELSLKVTERPIYGSSRLGSDTYALELGGEPPYNELDDPHGLVKYELTDHLGNVTAVVTDELLGVDVKTNEEYDYFQPYLVSAQGYEPFGALLPGRNYSSDSYRFGFQGQEKDDEMHGATGTSYSYEYRMHDARVGRFLSLDPLSSSYPWNSPYSFAMNRVIDGIELEGLEFIRFEDAKVKVLYTGEVEIDLPRCSDVFSKSWEARDRALGKSGRTLTDPSGVQFMGAYPRTVGSVDFAIGTSGSSAKSGADLLGKQDHVTGLNRTAQAGIQRYNNGTNKLDGRFSSHKFVQKSMGSAGRNLAFEVGSLLYNGYTGWKAMLVDEPAFQGDVRAIESQQDLTAKAAEAMQGYLANNSVNPELLSGDNGANLFAYVLMGEMRGEDERVFQLGNSILDALGLNRYEKVRTDGPTMPGVTLGNEAGTTTPSDNTRVVTRPR